ncbi:hypothetical protein C1T15_29115, partial [Escherichia coli]
EIAWPLASRATTVTSTAAVPAELSCWLLTRNWTVDAVVPVVAPELPVDDDVQPGSAELRLASIRAQSLPPPPPPQAP